MPLSRLENFLVNTDGNILYVNPSDLDATDSFDNKGNSLTRPFVTIQRALLEAARFSYQSGSNNDRFDKTTILLYPGTHYIDNRPGYYIKNNAGTAQYYDVNKTLVQPPDNQIELTNSSDFDITSLGNILYKFNSVEGGVVVPKGTSIVGLDLRKTKVKPLYVPDPENNLVERSAIFRVTGGCYFWQFSIFDADRAVYYNYDYGSKASPSYSHNKLTVFEYADGINLKDLTNLSDLQMYYYKLMNAYGSDTGNRQIIDYPTSNDFEPNSPEFKIVGDLTSGDTSILRVTSSSTVATVTTGSAHGLSVDDSIRIAGVGSDLYNGSFKVVGVTSATNFTYQLPSVASDTVIDNSGKIIIESDNVNGASPYIFNCSLRSAYGMCGLHADGSKATGFKSMVVAQYTGIGLQKDDNAFIIYNESTGLYDTNSTTLLSNRPLHNNQEAIYKPTYENYHIKTSNDAFIQNVSVFAIGFSQHFLAEDGSDQSITNSNSNFGSKSLISKGFRKESFDRDDTGYITHIVPPKDLQEDTFNVLWKLIDVNLTTSYTGVGQTSRLYLLGETDINNPPSNVTNGYRVGSNFDENLYFTVNINGVDSTYSSPVLMQVASGDGPISQKTFTVNSIGFGVTANQLTLNTTHNFYNGESVRIYSDTGIVPDGLENGELYYTIVGGASTISLAKTINNANSAAPTDAISIKNTKGGVLSIVSRVTDKLPGDPGHPIQFDTANKNWYILSSSSTTTNTIYKALKDNTSTISSNNSSTFIKRKSENRDLTDRIYKLRYVIPKEYTNAKPPVQHYVLQESKIVSEDSTITDVRSNRNSHIIAGITTVGSTVTVATERPHRLSISDRVRIRNVASSTNPNYLDNLGFNGYFTVSTIPSTKSFTFTNPNNGGTFANSISTRDANLPVFSKNEYDTTYTIQNVETIQDYSSGTQDGIYYLTCLIGNISPSATSFSNLKFKQNINDLYPVVDKDNLITDPEQSLTSASDKLIGKVISNNTQNSITKETILNYIKDNRIGFAVTGATSTSSGISTIFTLTNHNLNSIINLTISSGGSGYGSGISSTLYNIALSGGNGSDATANVNVSAAGTITAVSIVDGGSAYSIGNVLTVGSGSGTVTVSAINNNVGDVVQIVGVGTVGNRNNGAYNGLYKISAINSAKSITYNIGTNPGIYTTSSGIFYVVDDSLPISTIAGVANVTTAGIVTVTTSRAHGLSVGNKIKITGVTGTASTIFNSDFFVKEKVSLTAFAILAPIGVGTAAGSAEVYKYGITSYGEDTSLKSEKISGSLMSINSGITTTTSGSIVNNNTSLTLSSTVGFKAGDFIQLDDEILRISSVGVSNQVSVLRGVLGTRSSSHDSGSVVRKIFPIPSETRRFTSIRASGHTFEYLGYGPGNYSTAFPQRQTRVITDEEERLSITKEEKGGVVFFSGMNDRGDFFTGDKLIAKERFIGEIPSDSTATYDDVYIRNTLRVGGGPNRLLPSEFRGPVNFTNKVTSTASQGIEAIKLQLKGNSTQNPSLQIGSDSNPALIINELNQYVGIKTAIPSRELDVNGDANISGSIRANGFENFQLSDLPTTDESTFVANRVLKVKNDSSGYELVDSHELDTYRLKSLKVSNDGTVYSGIGSTVSSALQISGVSTSKFYVGEKVKVFGISSITDPVPDPIGGMTASAVGGLSPTVVGITSGYLSENPDSSITQIITTGLRNGDIVTGPNVPSGTYVIGVGASTISVNQGITAGIGTFTFTFTRYSHTYRYWVAQYHLRDGRVGIATQIAPSVGFTMSYIDDFNNSNNISLTLARTSASYGLLVYRQIGITADINSAKLVAILGPKELGSNTAGITWADYGTYDQTEWSSKGTVNEYDSDQIHFPNIATTGQRKGWALDTIVSIGSSSIRLTGQYNRNSDNAVKVVHDNTYSLALAINRSVQIGQQSLDLPSGTYLTNKLIIPSGFTLRGNGKNSVIKTQYFATDETDGGGNQLSLDGNIVGVGTTNASNISVYNLTIDGNNGNNILFDGELDNYIMKFENIKSSEFKDVEIRNSPANGLYIKNSSRVSIDNCSFVDGSNTDIYPFNPLYAQESETLRINDCLFENYPAAVDLSVTSVVTTGGNIIRNCGTGLKTYASGKITTTNNIILGPADEYIASADIYDSDFNSINLTIDRGVTFNGPVLQYLENGSAKDLSSSKVSIISAGIGTIVGQGTTNETLGARFLNFNITTPDSGSYGRANGYIQLSLTSTQTATLGLSSSLGYNIIAQEYNSVPVGFTTYIGIGTGAFNTIGAGATQYTITLSDYSQFSGISTGDVIKLSGHSSSPDLSSYELTVAEKINAGPIDKRLRLTGFTTTGITNGSQTGYISIRNTFTIAKGRIGVI